MDNPKRSLFLKFIHDECSPEEVELLLQYLQNPEEDAACKDLMNEVWLKLKTYPSVGYAEKEQQFKIILDRSRKENDAKVKPIFGRYGIRIAAACMGFLLVSSMVYLLFFQTSATTYQTGFGETLHITLPDGSEVVLNNNSTLRFNADLSAQATREVFLEGEAFFSVVHTHNDQPFMVRTTEEVSVEVLGTQFNVHNRHHTTEVVLNEGKVKVNINAAHEKQEVLMEPGEWVAYSQITQQYQKKLIDAETYTSWKDNMLIFEEQSLRDIARSLEDNYGYSVRFVDEETGDYKFTGTIPTDKVDALFFMLEKSFDLEIERKDKTVWIKPDE